MTCRTSCHRTYRDLIRNRRETLHQDFLEQYAILEDKKRKIVAAIAEAQEELIVCPSAPTLSMQMTSSHSHSRSNITKRTSALDTKSRTANWKGWPSSRVLVSVCLFPLSCCSVTDFRSVATRDIGQELGTLRFDS